MSEGGREEGVDVGIVCVFWISSILLIILSLLSFPQGSSFLLPAEFKLGGELAKAFGAVIDHSNPSLPSFPP